MAALQLVKSGSQPAVLLVDDEKVVLDVMARMLKSAGFTMVVAESGEQALQHLATHEFACALVDKNLQGMDGLEVIRHVRKRQPRCACVLMTAYASTGSAVEALRLGVVDYLEKPSPELDVIGERIQGAIRAQGVRDQQGALVQRINDLEKDGKDGKGQEAPRAPLALELALTSEIDGPAAVSASAAVRGERDHQLLRGAQSILARLCALRARVNPVVQPVVDRLAKDAADHIALLREG